MGGAAGRTGAGSRGGERIPPLYPTRAAGLACVAAAVALAAGLGALVATDAGVLSKLTWAATGFAALLVALAPLTRSCTPAHLAVALLGALLAGRQEARLVLAPVYGATLLLIVELATRSLELRAVKRASAAALGSRLAAVLSIAAAGACGSAAAAAAVTAAPGRSPALTAGAAFATLAMFAAITRAARAQRRASGELELRTEGNHRDDPRSS